MKRRGSHRGPAWIETAKAGEKSPLTKVAGPIADTAYAMKLVLPCFSVEWKRPIYWGTRASPVLTVRSKGVADVLGYDARRSFSVRSPRIQGRSRAMFLASSSAR